MCAKKTWMNKTDEYAESYLKKVRVLVSNDEWEIDPRCSAYDPRLDDKEHRHAYVLVPAELEYAPDFDFVGFRVVGGEIIQVVYVPVDGGYVVCRLEYEEG